MDGTPARLAILMRAIWANLLRWAYSSRYTAVATPSTKEVMPVMPTT